MRQDWFALMDAPDEFMSDRKILLEAVRQHGLALAYAPEERRADREIVLQAVKQDWTALKHAMPELRADREVVLEAVKGTRARSSNEPVTIITFLLIIINLISVAISVQMYQFETIVYHHRACFSTIPK